MKKNEKKVNKKTLKGEVVSDKTDKTRIDPYRLLDMKVYGYALPGVPSHEGCVKVGETEREDI